MPSRRTRTLSIAALTLLALAAMPAQARPGDRLKAWLAARQSAQGTQKTDAAAPAAAPAQQLAYGTDPLQKLEYWPAAGGHGTPVPLVVFVHGGAWSKGDMDSATGKWKPAHYPGEGYAFASLDYRLVPAASVEQQAGDIALALRKLIDDAPALGFDPRRIVLMGHSAGAQLVALVGTDERYLRGAGLSFASLNGVIPIDGAAYDVPTQMKDGAPMMQSRYLAAFGSDPTRQRALSPTFQAAAPNAPRFLLLHVQRPDGVRQAEALEAALKAAGTPVERDGFPGTGLQGHAEINRRMGDPAYPATATVDRWLKAVFGG